MYARFFRAKPTRPASSISPRFRTRAAQGTVFQTSANTVPVKLCTTRPSSARASRRRLMRPGAGVPTGETRMRTGVFSSRNK